MADDPSSADHNGATGASPSNHAAEGTKSSETENRTTQREDTDERSAPSITSPDIQASADLLQVGQSFGRYLLLRELGAGGMGVVFVAFDQELERQVALKFMHAVAPDGAKTSPSLELQRTHALLLHEAQALAKISHPNVVAVYDVGSTHNQVFISMELLSGGDLKQWLREKKRTQRDILSRFLSAGRGLLAAHGAELVHQDFKPENVLIAADGRICVADFGLANLNERPAIRRAAGDAGDKLDITAFTAADGKNNITGTPSYMSPEQHRGDRLDARSDQYSFCVSLHEALYGIKPYKGAGQREIASAIALGRRERPSATAFRKVPRALRSAIERGLSLDPADRFVSMSPLLEIIEEQLAPASFWMRFASGMTTLSIIATSAIVSLQDPTDTPEKRCIERADRMLDEARHSDWHAITKRFLAINEAFAHDALLDVQTSLTGHIDQLERHFHASCEARSSDASGTRLDAQMQCLELRLAETQAMIAMFQEANRSAIQRTSTILSNLSSPESCSDPRELRRAQLLPEDPRERTLALELERELRTLEIDGRGEREDTAADVAKSVLERAKDINYPIIEARAHTLLAQFDAGQFRPKAALSHLGQAQKIALETGDELLTREVYLRSLFVEGYRLVQFVPDISELRSMAYAQLERSHPDAVERAQWQVSLIPSLAMRGDPKGALAMLRPAVKTLRQYLGPRNAQTLQATDYLAVTLELLGRDDEALYLREQLLPLLEADLGESHPSYQRQIAQLSVTYLNQLQWDRALVLFKEASAYMRSDGASSLNDYLRLHTIFAAFFQLRNQHEQALALFIDSQQRHQASTGPLSPELLYAVGGVMGESVVLDKPELADRFAEHARQILAQHRNNQRVRGLRASIHLGLAQYELSRDLPHRAIEELDAFANIISNSGPDITNVPGEYAMLHATAGLIFAKAGDFRNARVSLSRFHPEHAVQVNNSGTTMFRLPALREVAHAYLLLDDTAHAREMLDDWERSLPPYLPDNDPAWLELRWYQGQLAAAHQHFSQALRLYDLCELSLPQAEVGPNWLVEFRIAQGDALAARGQSEAAQRRYEQAASVLSNIKRPQQSLQRALALRGFSSPMLEAHAE